MVGLLIRLKLALLKNSLKRSVWRTIGLVLGLLYALGVVIGVLAGMVALRWTSAALTADVTVVAFSALTLGWLLMSLLVFGVDETVDPGKFALLPLRSTDLLPGLFLAGFVGSPGIATVLASSGLIIAWTRDVPLAMAAVVAFPLGVATCVLLSRAGTTAFARFLSSRRFRDFAFVALALLGLLLGVAGNLFGQFAQAGPSQLRSSLTDAAQVAAWTPFGWAWAIPADVARGHWGQAAVHLVLAAGLVAGLWRVWGYFLGLRLVEPTDPAGAAVTVKPNSAIDRLFPASPAGGVATRTLRYWRRDPRYLASVAGFLVAPVIIMVTQLANPDGNAVLAMFAPAILGAFIGVGVAQDLSYDGSALWLHISTGLRGADDRAGRVMSAVVIFGPLLLILLVAAGVLTGEWRLLPAVLGVTITVTLTGLGVGSVVGAVWQWPAPPPGASPFHKGSSGGLPALLSFTVSTLVTLGLSLPTLALVISSIWTPWLAYVSLAVGIITGLIALKLGITRGGAILERRWPEVLKAVSEKAA
jgi:ABC-2 type transport system permease protein